MEFRQVTRNKRKRLYRPTAKVMEQGKDSYTIEGLRCSRALTGQGYRFHHGYGVHHEIGVHDWYGVHHRQGDHHIGMGSNISVVYKWSTGTDFGR